MVSAHSEAEKNNESIREKLTELAITLEQGSVSSNSPVLQAAARQIGALRANDLIRNEKRKIKGAAKPMDELLQQKRKAKIYQRKHRVSIIDPYIHLKVKRYANTEDKTEIACSKIDISCKRHKISISF